MRQQAQLHNSITLLLGLWLFATPWVFGIAAKLPLVSWNFWLAGALMALLSFEAFSRLLVWQEGGNITLGAWMILSPFLLSYTAMKSLMWSSVIASGAVVVISALALPAAIRGANVTASGTPAA